MHTPDDLAIAHHSDFVGDREHFLEFVSDNDDCFPLLAHATQVDPDGWFFKVHVSDMAEFEQLMDGPAYDVLVKNS